MSGSRACPEPPEEFTARIFFLHACALQDPLRGCLAVVQKAKNQGLYIRTYGNDNRYVFPKMADKYGVKGAKDKSAKHKKRKGAKDEKPTALDILEAYFANGESDGDEYAVPAILSASYEINKKFRKKEKEDDVKMTGDQIAYALCGLLLTMTGRTVLRGEVYGSFYLLSGLTRDEVKVDDLFSSLIEQARGMPRDVGVAVKRLYLSAAGSPTYTPVELVIAEGKNRADIVYINKLYLYDLAPYPQLRSSLTATREYLYNDDEKKVSEYIASRVQMFFGTMQEFGGRKCGDPRWLYDALRELHRLKDESGAVGRYAREMYRGLVNLLEAVCL
jgi:hypothetical protein